MEHDYELVVMGSGAVGKSALVRQWVDGIFVEKHIPTVGDGYRMVVEIEEQKCILEITDTAGTMCFPAMRDLYMSKGDGFLLVYSVTSKESFEYIADLRDQILRKKYKNDVPMVLVGNKWDLKEERVVSKELEEQLAIKLGCAWMETSAKEKINVEIVFFELLEQISGKIAKPWKKKKKKKSTCFLL